MHKKYLISCLFCLLFIIPGIFDTPTNRIKAQSKQELQEKITACLTCYTDLEFDKGITLARELLTYNYITALDSLAIYEALAINTFAKGNEEDYDKSYSYLNLMSSIGPCLLNLPREKWNKRLIDHWYQVNLAKGITTCPKDSSKGIQTIAFMPFDNYSLEKYLDKLGYISIGLAEMFVNDFQIISSLRVIERANLDALLKEHELSQTGKVDKSTAIEIGKLLGAQLMVFGSITQLDDKHTRMVARAVKVETSEIITSVDIEGKPEYFKLEKELVKQLADKLDIDLNKKTMELIDKNGTDSDEAANFYAKGLYFMDRYDYSNAYDNFKKAYEIDDEFVQAKNMLDTYQPLVGFLVNK